MIDHAVQDANLYAPPQSAVVDLVAEGETPQFYVVAPAKCMTLYFATLGVYGLYWFWRHWSLQNRRYNLGIWPVARAIFQVFFTHSLFREIDFRLERVDARYRWSPAALAWLYVIFGIVGSVLDRMAANSIGSPVTDVLSLLVLLPTAYALLHAQKAANTACGDPKGERNRRFTAANYLWLILGFLLWALVAIGLLSMMPGVLE